VCIVPFMDTRCPSCNFHIRVDEWLTDRWAEWLKCMGAEPGNPPVKPDEDVGPIWLSDQAAFARLPFPVAFYKWLSERKRRLADNTWRRHQWRFRPLYAFFGDRPLETITALDLHQYQHWRTNTGFVTVKENGKWVSREVAAKTEPDTINHELSVIQQLLKKAGRWHLIRDLYEPLPVPNYEVGKALTEEQERRLFEVASSNPRWRVAYLAAKLTAHTTAGPSEIKHLRLRDVDLERREITVREGTKNKYRVRLVPLNDDAYWAASQLLERAKAKGASDPDHYLLPGKTRQGYDPAKPMSASGWRTAWRSLRQAAGMPSLRPYDLRHHAITKLAEKPEVSEQVIQDIAGHVSQRMLRHYSHIRMRAKREALELLSRPKGGGAGAAA